MRYSVSYVSGATGFGWEHDFESIKDFEDFIQENRSNWNCGLKVWDESIQDFIFWKDVLSRPTTDLITRGNRDLRTTTKKKLR